jgi:hypothetical protein
VKVEDPEKEFQAPGFSIITRQRVWSPNYHMQKLVHGILYEHELNFNVAKVVRFRGLSITAAVTLYILTNRDNSTQILSSTVWLEDGY